MEEECFAESLVLLPLRGVDARNRSGSGAFATHCRYEPSHSNVPRHDKALADNVRSVWRTRLAARSGRAMDHAYDEWDKHLLSREKVQGEGFPRPGITCRTNPMKCRWMELASSARDCRRGHWSCPISQ